MRLCPWSLALASSIPVLGLERFCPRKGCPWPWPWPRIFFVSLALALASSLVSSTPPLVESNRKQILGSFSSEVTLNSKQNAWKIVAFKVSWCFSSSVLSRSLGFLHYIITVSLLRNIVLNLFDVKRVSRGL